jgi:hypothetical protein
VSGPRRRYPEISGPIRGHRHRARMRGLDGCHGCRSADAGDDCGHDQADHRPRGWPARRGSPHTGRCSPSSLCGSRSPCGTTSPPRPPARTRSSRGTCARRSSGAGSAPRECRSPSPRTGAISARSSRHHEVTPSSSSRPRAAGPWACAPSAGTSSRSSRWIATRRRGVSGRSVTVMDLGSGHVSRAYHGALVPHGLSLSNGRLAWWVTGSGGGSRVLRLALP